MKLYELRHDVNHYDTCDVYKPYDGSMIAELKGIFISDYDTKYGYPFGSNWTVRKLVRKNELPVGDCIAPLGGNLLAMSLKSIEILRHILGEIEILSAVTNFGEYAILNILSVLDCVDLQNSVYETFEEKDQRGNARIMGFKKIEFRPAAISNYHIFRLPGFEQHLFVDEHFVNAINEHHISGLKFRAIWTDEGSLEEIYIHTKDDMTENDYTIIENNLNIRLPAYYKEALSKNELANCGHSKEIMHDPEQIVKVNMRLRTKGIYGIRLRPEHFIITYIPQSTTYRYIDLSDSCSPVYLINRKKGFLYDPDKPANNIEFDSMQHFIKMHCWAIWSLNQLI